MRFLAQEFANDIANDSTASPEQCYLLFTHLSKYVNKILLYLLRKQQKISTSSQTTKENNHQIGMTAPPSMPKREKSSAIELRKKIKEKEKFLKLAQKRKIFQKTRTQKSNTSHANRNTTESYQRGFFSAERTSITK